MKQYKNKIIIAAAIFLAAAIIITVIVLISINTDKDFAISQTQDGSVQIETTITDLKSSDIDYGDSLTIKCSSGYICEDVALLNKEILNSGQHIAIAESPTSKIIFKIQGASGLWNVANLENNSKAHIKIKEKQKYLNLYKAFNIPASGDTKDLRSIRGGKLALLDLFRCSPEFIAPDMKVALKNYQKSLNIEQIINLDDNDNNIHSINLKDKTSNGITVSYLLQIAKANQHCLIFSTNPDYTAYFSALIECIAGSSYSEIVQDYMKTYETVYGITKETHPEEYEAIQNFHIDWFLQKLCKTPDGYDMNNCDFAYESEMYLRSCGVGDEDIALIKSRFNKQ